MYDIKAYMLIVILYLIAAEQPIKVNQLINQSIMFGWDTCPLHYIFILFYPNYHIPYPITKALVLHVHKL